MSEEVVDQVHSLQQLGHSFVEALRQRDFIELATLFQPGVRGRVLTDSGMLTPDECGEVVACYRKWFAAADQFELLDSRASAVADRLSLYYRFRMHDHEGWFLVEQQAYASVEDGKIADFDLLSSGFRPISGPPTPWVHHPGA